MVPQELMLLELLQIIKQAGNSLLLQDAQETVADGQRYFGFAISKIAK
jgi:hypothetical protein